MIKTPTIHLIVGFIGAGKTTMAKCLADKIMAERFTHDEIMVEKYGRNPDDFETKYKIVDAFIREEAAKYIQAGKDVILDYGFWSHKGRNEYYQWAKSLTDHVVFHVVNCDLKIAKSRALNRTQNDDEALFIDENAFDKFLAMYEPWSLEDNYPVVFYNSPVTQYIGNTVYAVMDRPMGAKHPKFKYSYPVNYGYVPYTIGGDGEELDVYVLGVNHALESFAGQCIAVIHRTDDNDDKLIVVPQGTTFTDEEIEEKIYFQEQWFKHILLKK